MCAAEIDFEGGESPISITTLGSRSAPGGRRWTKRNLRSHVLKSLSGEQDKVEDVHRPVAVNVAGNGPVVRCQTGIKFESTHINYRSDTHNGLESGPIVGEATAAL